MLENLAADETERFFLPFFLLPPSAGRVAVPLTADSSAGLSLSENEYER